MSEQTPKKQKVPGPIRWNAVIPFSIVVALFSLYMTMFFDGHLRLLTQWGLTKAMGVQVDVREFKTSFWNAHMRIAGIEVTDSEIPSQNTVSVGEIRFGMLWDALLRAKIVVNEAVVEQIEFAKPRKSPGWVAPPEPVVVGEGGSVIMTEADKMKNAALEKIQKEQEQNVFGDLAAILGGSNAQVQLDQIKDSLVSKKMAEDLEKQIKTKQTLWNDRLKTLPKGSEFQALGDRMKAVKTKDFKSPQELQNSLQTLDAIFKEADAKIKTVQSAKTDLDADLKKIQDDVKLLEAQIKADVKKLEAHFKIPKIDAKAITMSLFRKYIDKYLNKFKTYRALAEKYVPPNLLNKSGEPEAAIQPRPRAEGLSYEFGRPNSYPLVWIKRTAVSSQAGLSPYSGNITGEITDITTNQLVINKPTVATITGDFPSAQIGGFKTRLSIDNRAALSLIELQTTVASYMMAGRDLLTGDVKIGFKKARGSIDVKASLKGLKELELNLDNRFSEIEYDIAAKEAIVDELLKKIFAGIPQVTVDGRLSGVFPQINLGLNSNLGPEVQAGLSREVNAKIAEARLKIEQYVQAEVGKTKAQIDGEITKLRTQVDGEIKKLQAQAEAQKKQAETRADQAKKDAENSAKKGLENEAKKAADELKKRLGF